MDKRAPDGQDNVIQRGTLEGRRRQALAKKILRHALDKWSEEGGNLLQNDKGESGIGFQFTNSIEWGELSGAYFPRRDAEHWTEGAEKMLQSATITVCAPGETTVIHPAEEMTAPDRESFIEATAETAMLLYFSFLFDKLDVALDETLRDAEQCARIILLNELSEFIEDKKDLPTTGRIDPREIIESMVKDRMKAQRARLTTMFQKVPRVKFPTGRGQPKLITAEEFQSAIKRKGGPASVRNLAKDFGVDRQTIYRTLKALGYKDIDDAKDHLLRK